MFFRYVLHRATCVSIRNTYHTYDTPYAYRATLVAGELAQPLGVLLRYHLADLPDPHRAQCGRGRGGAAVSTTRLATFPEAQLATRAIPLPRKPGGTAQAGRRN